MTTNGRADILIVDDQPKTLRLLTTMLEKQGFRVRTAIDGDVALEAVANQLPDLILLDIMMPNMNGYEVCQKLRAAEATQNIPIIFLSAITNTEDIVKAFTAGGNDYVSKPFQAQEVLARVETHLELRKMEQELKHKNMLLEQELMERRAAEIALREALMREKELSRLKSQFLTMVSHEFRTPLTVIQSSAELFATYHHRLNEDERAHQLENIRQSIKTITTLLDNSLLLNYAESNILPYHPVAVDVVRFCKKLVEEINNLNPKRTIHFSHEPARIHVEIDPQLTRYILLNVLNNAIKYSPVTCPIMLEVHRYNGNVQFRVEDQGIGIPANDLVHLFEPFYRAKNVGETAGLGIGLSVAKLAIDLHQGTIQIDSQENRGTTITITLPA